MMETGGVKQKIQRGTMKKNKELIYRGMGWKITGTRGGNHRGCGTAVAK